MRTTECDGQLEDRVDTARGLLTETDKMDKISKDNTSETSSSIRMMEKARKLSVIESKMIVTRPQFKTLFNGIRLSDSDFHAAVHPLFYIFRRLLYAIAIVFLADFGLLATLLLQLACLGQLCLLSTFNYWRTSDLNRQHFCNEVILLVTLSLKLVTASTTDTLVIERTSNGIIALVCSALFLNLAICLLYILEYADLVVRRYQSGYNLPWASLFMQVEDVKRVSSKVVPADKKTTAY